MPATLSFASSATVILLIGLAVMVLWGLMRAVRVASGASRRESAGESAMLSMALQEALTKLKDQERATAARAEASERLADQIVAGLTSGLVVVNRAGIVQAINPAAQRILELADVGTGRPFREALGPVAALADLIAEAIEGLSPIVRRTITIGGGASTPSRRDGLADHQRRRPAAGVGVPLYRPHGRG